MELLRDDKVMSVTVPLSVSDFLCPVHFDGRAPSYFVLGGLVFTVMSTPYLEVQRCFTFSHVLLCCSSFSMPASCMRTWRLTTFSIPDCFLLHVWVSVREPSLFEAYQARTRACA